VAVGMQLRAPWRQRRRTPKQGLRRWTKSRPTRGEGQHEVDGGDCKTAARGGALSPASERKQRNRRGAEDEERRKRSRDSFANFKSYRDPTEKYFFPLIQGFSERKSNMKIVEFFKLYTFALKLKFKNSKFATLQNEF
jgi:hypothetical protein